MQVKKHSIHPCGQHQRFMPNCNMCIVDSLVRLCELLEEHPEIAQTDEPAVSNGLTEVFEGFNVAHITDHSITNVTALTMTPADFEEGIVRYIVEFRKDK